MKARIQFTPQAADAINRIADKEALLCSLGRRHA